MISSQPKPAISHIPTPLDLPDFDDDDVFDVKDSENLPYVFSPDAIREEMARNMPETEETWGEGDSTASTRGFTVDDHNDSVSTLDIGPQATNGFDRTPPALDDTLDSSLSSTFSQISLSTPDEEYPPHRLSSSEDIPPVGSDGNPASPSELPERSVSPQGVNTPPAPSPPQRQRNSSDIYPSPIPTSAPLPRIDHSSLESIPPAPNSSSASTSQPVTSFSLPAIPATAPLSNGLLTEKPRSHRPHRSVGPSAFEKVRSKTRPTFLPPKPRQEDEKHMADWQKMMKQSRAIAEKRRKALQERRAAREKAIEDDLHIWEKEILPDWRVVHKKPELRKLWWHGIPTKLRAPLWEKAVGNELALSKDHYRTCLARAKRALASGIFPQATLELIDQDMETTLPAIHIFNKENGPLYPDLKDMLCAWVVSRSDEGLGYTIGAAKIAAMLLINMPSQQAFVVMRNLLERHCMRSFFGGERSKDDVEAYYRIFDTLLADGMPKIYFNFKQHQISPGAYLPDWVVPLFLDHLPFEACARIWDVLLLEGDSFLYRASLGILAILEPRLFFPDKKELLELLKGENKAAIEVAKREGRSLIGGKYEIYGVDEETLWGRIDSMEDWWKESTWTRLIQRELPDL
ncbi:hypothetical protein GALMADRAFT_234381 [Galerina marginata CBS 339.88]|uniref:Rab-GAP TBC domain-containing protein n=1 Tax=Galerina marginata (strain CBS 339.88) TaxID=685588 RepID=A0A067U284_GALM3|nr:hypothetical protein GALMADRAFT_234381 [Galerina marginata CBS 339.88]